jgi:hypothetical protein
MKTTWKFLLICTMVLGLTGCAGVQWKTDAANLGFCLAQCGLSMASDATSQTIAGDTATFDSVVLPKIPCLSTCAMQHGLALLIDVVTGADGTKDMALYRISFVRPAE